MEKNRVVKLDNVLKPNQQENGKGKNQEREKTDVLMEKLRQLSPDLAIEYNSLSSEIKLFLQAKNNASNEEINDETEFDYAYNPLFGWIRKFRSRADAKRFLEEDARAYRYENFEYNADDVASMPQNEVEERSQITLRLFLNESGFEENFRFLPPDQIKENFADLINNFWQNRLKEPEQIELLFSQELADINQRLLEFEKQFSQLKKEIDRWSAKKNRFAKQQLELAHQAFYQFKEQARQKILNYQERKRQIFKLHRRQRALNYLFRRLDGLEYSMAFAYALDGLSGFGRFSEARKNELKNKLEFLQDYLENSSQTHLEEPAIDKALVEDEAVKKTAENILQGKLDKQKLKSVNKLVERLSLLIQRAELIEQKKSKIQPADSDNLDDIGEKHALVRELKIIFHLLKKIEINFN